MHRLATTAPATELCPARAQALQDRHHRSRRWSASRADAVRKLDPRALVKNPVIFVTAVVSALVTVLFVRDLVTGQPALFTGQIAAWLWFTVLFANFAEAIAEGRGRAQADTLRRAREETRAKRILMPGDNREIWEPVDASQLRPGDVVLVEAGDMIPGDGEVDRRRRLGERGGHHGRVRARDPRGRRRPLGGDRRHHRALRLDRGEDHVRRRAPPSSTA